MKTNKLTRTFYSRPTLEVAADLIGAVLVDERTENVRTLRIVEVEAYIGEDDPACHAARGKTKRNEVMYGPPGHAYIYFIYGMYHCLNIVTEQEGFPAAVLIRAAEPLSGALEINPRTGEPYVPNGPGKLTLAINLDLGQNGLDLVDGGMYVASRIVAGAGRAGRARVETSPRIGVSAGRERKWRFFDPDSKFLSQRASRYNRSGARTAKDKT